jgi:hypothetical protein
MVFAVRFKRGGMFVAALTSMVVLLSASASQGLLLTERPCAGDFCTARLAEDSPADLPVKTKSPVGAVIRSGLVPGWGQLYNEQYLKSGLVFVMEGVLVGAAVVEHRRSQDDLRESKDLSRSDEQREAAWLRYSRRIDKRNTYLWYLAGAKFLSMVDAYVDAHLYRFEEGPFTLELDPGPVDFLDMRLVLSYKMR